MRFRGLGGLEAKIELKELVDGRSRFRGIIEGMAKDEVRLRIELKARTSRDRSAFPSPSSARPSWWPISLFKADLAAISPRIETRRGRAHEAPETVKFGVMMMAQAGVSANRLELLQIADAVAREKSIDRQLVIGAMEDAIQKAAKSRYGSENEIRAEIDPKTGEIRLARLLEVVEAVTRRPRRSR